MASSIFGRIATGKRSVLPIDPRTYRAILTHRPLAIYVRGERLKLWQTGRSESKIAQKKAKHRDVELDICRQYILIYEWIKGASAVTFGHTVLARDRQALEATRRHERVHVRQYEIWGPLFIPAYLACWVWLPLRGKHPYHDNPFEKAAFAAAEDEPGQKAGSDGPNR